MKMPLGVDLARIYREKRRLILPLAILAVINLAALLLVVYPLSRRVAATEARAQTSATRLAKASQEYRAARATLEGRERTDKQLERFYAEILPRDQTAARRITYLKLAKLAREADLLYENRSFTVEEPRDSMLTRMNILVPLHGDYADMRQFIHTLETAPEFLVIRDVQLAKGKDEKSSALTLQLNLTTFYRTEGNGPDRDRQ